MPHSSLLLSQPLAPTLRALAPCPPQLAWRPSTEALPSFVIVTVEGALLAGTPADPAPAPLPLAAPAGAACAAWSPGGGQLAVGRGDEVAVCGPDGGQRFAVKVVSQEVVEGQHLQVGAACNLWPHVMGVRHGVLNGAFAAASSPHRHKRRRASMEVGILQESKRSF